MKKSRILSNTQTFYEGKSEILIAFEENLFPSRKLYNFDKNEWKETDLDRNEFMSMYFFKKSFLEKYDHIPLSEKENKLLNRDFGYKNVDQLMDAFNNTENDEELND